MARQRDRRAEQARRSPSCRSPTASRWCAQVLAEATTPPRWPMYLRQMKQFIRTARPDFDERRYGSLQDLLRACQKDGLVRLERDRQGGLRAFAGASQALDVPHGWAARCRLKPPSPMAMARPPSDARRRDGCESRSPTGDQAFRSRSPRAAPLEATPPDAASLARTTPTTTATISSRCSASCVRPIRSRRRPRGQPRRGVRASRPERQATERPQARTQGAGYSVHRLDVPGRRRPLDAARRQACRAGRDGGSRSALRRICP